VLAGTLWVILLPLYFLFFHFRPEDKGLKPYGAEELVIAKSESLESSATNHEISHDWTLRQALGTYQLWMLMLSYFLFWGIGTYLVIAHQVKFAEDVGYSSTFAVSIFALYGFSLIGGQLSCGISDRIGREVTITLGSTLMIIALIALVSVNDSSQPWLLYMYAICFGYGGGFFTPTLTAGAADIFHGKHFGAIAGILLTGMGIGGVIGPWLGGYIHDITGSYTSAFFLCMAAFFLACIAFWIAAPRNADKLNAKIMKIPPLSD
jgi:MFS family permease